MIYYFFNSFCFPTIEKLYSQIGKVSRLHNIIEPLLPCFWVLGIVLAHILELVTQPAGLASLNYGTVGQWKVGFNLTKESSPPYLFLSRCTYSVVPTPKALTIEQQADTEGSQVSVTTSANINGVRREGGGTDGAIATPPPCTQASEKVEGERKKKIKQYLYM